MFIFAILVVAAVVLLIATTSLDEATHIVGGIIFLMLLLGALRVWHLNYSSAAELHVSREKRLSSTQQVLAPAGQRYDLDFSNPEAWMEVEGFPQANWEFFYHRICEHLPELEWSDAYTEAAREWLRRLGEHIDPGYQVYSTNRFLLLTTRSPASAAQLLDYAEHTEKAILDAFQLSLEEQEYGKRIIVLFHDHDTYHQYRGSFHREGEVSLSGGVYINQGYHHIALPDGEPRAVYGTMMHELVHACLSNLQLPLWLEEGMIRTMERKLGRFGQEPMLDERDQKLHLRHWNSETILNFWSGRSFSQPHPWQKLSYNLAEILVWILLAERFEQFSAFVHTAQREDFGESAAHECFGFGLGDLAAVFLGDGVWSPEMNEQDEGEEASAG